MLRMVGGVPHSRQQISSNEKIQSPLLAKQQDPSNEEIQSSPLDYPSVFVPSPWKSYVLASLPSLIILLSFILYAYLYAKGSQPAWPRVADMVQSDPRLSAQVVAVMGSLLTSIIKWGLSRAVTFTAQKRFLQFRSVYEAEIWASFKNGGVLWTSWGQGARRWLITATTTVLVVLCGLLTSGFVSLLSPLPIKISKEVAIIGESEVKISACRDWELKSWKVAEGTPCTGWMDYNGFKYQRCGSAEKFVEALDGGRASMLAHIQQLVSPEDPQGFMSSFSILGGARILGSTAGTIPVGPAGAGPFSVLESRSGPVTTRVSPQSMKQLNYTLVQEGVWINVSCQYAEPSVLPYRWPLPKDNQGSYIVNTTCPGGPLSNRTIEPGVRANLLLMDYCKDVPNKAWTIYLQSAFTPDSITGASSNEAYAGIGSMVCTTSAKIRNITSTFYSSLGGFKMALEGQDAEPLSDPMEDPNVNNIFFYVQHGLMRVQTPESHLGASLVDNLAVSRFGLPSGVKHEKYPALVASMLKGMLEHEMTTIRLVMTLSSVPAPEGCRHNITGIAEYLVIGWSIQSSTLLALIPLGILGVLLMTLLVLAALGDASPKTSLKVFDPTNPVSLIATASAGGVEFDSTIVGNPEDEHIRTARVKYGKILEGVGGVRWGLVKGPGKLT